MSTSIQKTKEACLARFKTSKNPKILGFLNQSLPLVQAKKLSLKAFAQRAEAIDKALSEELKKIQAEAQAFAICGAGKKVIGKNNIPRGQEKDYHFAGKTPAGEDIYVYNIQ